MSHFRVSPHALLPALAASGFAADPRYTIGINTNTRGGWENDVFLSFKEAREVGYRYVETFIHYFAKDYYDNPAALQQGRQEDRTVPKEVR